MVAGHRQRDREVHLRRDRTAEDPGGALPRGEPRHPEGVVPDLVRAPRRGAGGARGVRAGRGLHRLRVHRQARPARTWRRSARRSAVCRPRASRCTSPPPRCPARRAATGCATGSTGAASLRSTCRWTPRSGRAACSPTARARTSAASCEPAGLLWTPAFAMAAPQVGLARADGQQMEIIWGNRVSALNESWMDCTSDGTLGAPAPDAQGEPARVEAEVPPHQHHLGRPPAGTLRPDAEGPGGQGQRGLLRGQLRDGGRPGHLAGLRRPARGLPARDGLRQPAHLPEGLQARRAARALALPSVVNGLLLLFTIVLLLLVDKPPAFARAGCSAASAR